MLLIPDNIYLLLKTNFMQCNRFLKLMLVHLLLLCSIFSFAHPGGHYHKGDGTIFNTWTLKNGTIIKGNFSMGKGDFILLEQEEGKMIKIAVTDFIEQDQKLARFKINKFVRLNNEFESLNMEFVSPLNNPVTEKKEWSYSYLLLSVMLALATVLIFRKAVSILNKSVTTKTKLTTIAGCLTFITLTTYACKKSTDNVVTTTSIPKTTTSFIDSAYTPYKPAISTRWDDTYFYIASGGIPAHNMMVGITSWQQQVPIPQFYTGTNSWSIPLQPVYATTPLSTKTNFMKGAVAIAVNGIPIFNALNNRGEDSYLIGELDNWGGHCGKADDYHYHAAPLHLSATSGLKPIAFALDGFAVYGATEPDGAAMQTLDTCHGHIYNNGVYHYHGTANYPYVIGAMKGKVTTDPSTPAPENQILPQAFASPLRPATSPLAGASITAFTSTGTNAYKLTYKIGSAFGYIDYSWDATNKYTFMYTIPTGAVTTSTYQR
jgi:hypothetical protein